MANYKISYDFSYGDRYAKAVLKYYQTKSKEDKEAAEKAAKEWHEYLETRL